VERKKRNPRAAEVVTQDSEKSSREMAAEHQKKRDMK